MNAIFSEAPDPETAFRHSDPVISPNTLFILENRPEEAVFKSFEDVSVTIVFTERVDFHFVGFIGFMAPAFTPILASLVMGACRSISDFFVTSLTVITNFSGSLSAATHAVFNVSTSWDIFAASFCMFLYASMSFDLVKTLPM